MKRLSVITIALAAFAAFAPCTFTAQTARAADTVQINLPADELPHPKVDVEWWYYSGRLTDEDGNRYGVMASFFVFGAGNMPKMHFMIAQISDASARKLHTASVIDKNMVETVKMIVGGLPEDLRSRLPADMLDTDKVKERHRFMGKKAVVAKDRLSIDYDGETFTKTGDGADWRNWKYDTNLSGDGFSAALEMRPARGPMIVGGDGNVGEGVDMYYYSFTRMDTAGTLEIGGKKRKVKGTLWYDHQFGAFNKDNGPIGWDWFCVQLADGTDMNISALRDPETGVRSKRLATVQRPDGTQTVSTDVVIEPLGQWTSADTGFTYPSGWIIAIPSLGAHITVRPDFPEQEMRTFGPLQAIWEGACSAEAVIDGKPIKGDSYTELVGYNLAPGTAAEKRP